MYKRKAKVNAGRLLGIALCIGGQVAVAAQPVLPMCPGAPGLTEEQAAGHVRALEQGVLELDRATRHAYQALPFEQFQLAAAQRSLGEEPVAIFNWVRDETRWLPYAGALRGADGVLLDRSGSSLDRALLLAALLEEAGHVARLVKADLDVPARRALDAAWGQATVAQQVALPAPDQQALEDAAALQAVPIGELEREYQRQTQEFEQSRERLQAQTRRQVAALQAQQNSAVSTQVSQNAVSPEQSAELSNHWWVQWQGPDGWRDLDPALPEHRFGERLIAANDDLLEFHYPEELPDDYHHWLTIEIVAEQLAQGQLHEHIVMSQRLATMALTGQQLSIDTPPLRLPSLQPLIDGGAAREGLQETLLRETQWVPYLRHGDEVVRQKVINADGSVEDPIDGSVASFTTQALSDAVGALDALSLDGRPGSESAAEVAATVADPELTAVMVRLYVQAPGREVDVFERPLMDLLGSATRAADVSNLELSDQQRDQRAAALMGAFELMPQTSWLPPEQLSAWRYQEVLGSRQALQGAAYSLAYNDFSFVADILATQTTRRSELDALAALRLAYSPHLENIALTRLNLLAYVSLADYEQGQLRMRQGFDIIDNRVEVVGADDAASIRMTQGVLDTLLEAEVLDATTGATSTAINTARAYGQDLDAANDWQWLTHPDHLDTLDWAPDVDLRAHYHQQLSRGQVLIMPMALADTGQASWWQLDPVTGDMLGFGPDGRGQILEAVMRLFSAMDNASSAAMMAATIWGCMGNYQNEDPQCCVHRAAGEAVVSKALGNSMAAAAKGAWRVDISYSPIGSLGVLGAGIDYHAGQVAGEFTQRLFQTVSCQ